MATLKGRSFSSPAVSYPATVNSETQRKKYKEQLLRDSPETLVTDFMVLNGKETKVDLVFFTSHPEAWHQTLSSYNKAFKMAGNKAMRQLYLDSKPKFNINIYNNGTVMIQGSETGLDQFERDFSKLKARVEKVKPTVPSAAAAETTRPTPPPPAPSGSTTAPPSAPSPPAATLPHSPQTPRTVSVQRIQECLSFVEMEIAEFKESQLMDSDTTKQLMEEFKTFKKENELKIKNLELEMNNLKEQINSLNTELILVKISLEQKSNIIQSLTEQLSSLTTNSTTLESNPDTSRNRISADEHTLTTKPTLPASSTQQSSPATPTSAARPAETTSSASPLPTPPTRLIPTTETPQPLPTPTVPSTSTTSPSVQHQPATKTAILMDSNGRFLDPLKLFPTHRVAKFWCPTTESALKILCPSTLLDPQNIIIHTGTNNLRSKREAVAKSIKTVAEKAHEEFPTANIIISSLLHRKDFPKDLINKINQDILSYCSKIPNTRIAHHPSLSEDHLFDHVHLTRDAVRQLAKDLKDTTLDRTSPLLRPNQANPPRDRQQKPNPNGVRSTHRQTNQAQRSETHPSRTPTKPAPTTRAQSNNTKASRTQSNWAQPRSTQPSIPQPINIGPSQAELCPHPRAIHTTSAYKDNTLLNSCDCCGVPQQNLTYSDILQGKNHPVYTDIGEGENSVGGAHWPVWACLAPYGPSLTPTLEGHLSFILTTSSATSNSTSVFCWSPAH
ncbi:flocculation protein FLO11-like [Alosa sapidissima]|uniref:flocculation protein FLO11-like n=1 Tax=Alosa sapidissima TaxID=34773 RepID=UPI001C0965D0|nr:flocculation protein FLO11-like [Alosa sapidissima]